MSIGGIIRLVVITAICLAVLAIVVQVEDWSRDFSASHAESTDDASDPRLRPIYTRLGGQETLTVVRNTALGLPGWERNPEKGQLMGPVSELYFVRTSPIFGFEDDITVYVKNASVERIVVIESKSRVGTGDLGQNPRNVRMLHYRLERVLPSSRMP